jgi:ubiquinone biosynthesis protein COQ4
VLLPHPAKLSLLLKSALSALADPADAKAVGAVLDITSPVALEHLRNQMQASPDGRAVLEQRPLPPNSKDPSFEALKKLPKSTFGGSFHSFMVEHGFSPEGRPAVRYVDDEELAYVLLRYRLSHDYYHALLGLPPTVAGELVLKAVEALEFGLGGAALQAALGASGGAGLVTKGEREELREVFLPWVVRGHARRRGMESLLCVRWEEEWGTDIGELRERLGIEPAPEFEKRG